MKSSDVYLIISTLWVLASIFEPVIWISLLMFIMAIFSGISMIVVQRLEIKREIQEQISKIAIARTVLMELQTLNMQLSKIRIIQNKKRRSRKK